MAQHPAHAQHHRHEDVSSPIDFQKALAGVDYPTSRAKLVETARRNGASADIVEVVEGLPDKHYDSPTAVSRQIARAH